MAQPKSGEKKIKDVMQEDVIGVMFNTPVKKVIQLLKDKKISGVVVEDMVGEVLGIVSTLDIFKVMGDEAQIDSLIAEDIMTPYSINITPDDSLETAAKMMLENNIHRLVVVASPTRRRPIGIITATDVIEHL